MIQKDTEDIFAKMSLVTAVRQVTGIASHQQVCRLNPGAKRHADFAKPCNEYQWTRLSWRNIKSMRSDSKADLNC